MEPIIQPGNEWLVHHIILNACFYNNFTAKNLTPSELHGFAERCYMTDGISRPSTLRGCGTLVYAWGVGGGVCARGQQGWRE